MAAGVDEGMEGISTRFAFKALSATYNHDTEEVAADPVHLMYVLEQAIKREQFPDDTENAYLEFIKADLAPRYAEFIGHEIQKAYLESYHDYGQNLFDRYVDYADAWIEDPDVTPETREVLKDDWHRVTWDAPIHSVEEIAALAPQHVLRNVVLRLPSLAEFLFHLPFDGKAVTVPTWYIRGIEAVENTTFNNDIF